MNLRLAGLIVLLLALVIVFLDVYGVVSIREVPARILLHVAAKLIFGWMSFLARVVPQAHVNIEGIAMGICCVALLLAGGHFFLRWLARAMTPELIDTGHSEGGAPHAAQWPFRWTAAILAFTVLMFIAGISLVGVVHQSLWIATSPEPRLAKYFVPNSVQPVDKSLRKMGISATTDRDGKLPANGPAPFDPKNSFLPLTPEIDNPSHSWQSRILPYYGIDISVYYHADWNTPENLELLQNVAPMYLDPDVPVLREARGLAVSHYSGNRDVFDRETPLRIESVVDGTSQTILAGQAAADYQAWGDPSNLRDPRDGINRTRSGYGSVNPRGACVVMIDGSVRFLSTATDARVLEALATPDGGESSR